MTDTKTQFLQHNPGAFFLDADDIPGTQQYLDAQGWLAPDEVLQAQAKAGEGNMNCTLRLHTSQRTLVLKQARPWVEKYPSIPAPADRAVQEARFYQFVQETPAVAERMPTLLGMDEDAKTILMEDLGEGSDFLSLYDEGHICNEDQLIQLADYLSALHSLKFEPEQRETLTNGSMRELNHLHIFSLPLVEDNGIDLDAFTPGLQQVASVLRDDPVYVTTVTKAGKNYLSNGPTLQHGDFYPGSWLQQGEKIAILDPEFGFFGHSSFDVGICIGHLILARQPFSVIQTFIERYRTTRSIEMARSLIYAGVEIMRRLIGVAQLPIQADLDQKTKWLTLSHQLVLQPSLSLLN